MVNVRTRRNRGERVIGVAYHKVNQRVYDDAEETPYKAKRREILLDVWRYSVTVVLQDAWREVDPHGGDDNGERSA